uniref:Uncharacterized protein n=1 Tax=Peronospora matthiolae TaxID=2874970 RepID=A0AAV1TS69_9STRA
MDTPLSERDVLASLPPPPSAIPDYPTWSSEDLAEDSTLPIAISDEVETDSRAHRSKLPTSTAKASFAARSMAAVARSTISKSGRKLLSPRGKKSPKLKSKSPAAIKPETGAVESSEGGYATDSLASMAAAAGSLTSGLTSSFTSASSSLGSLLFTSRSSSVSNADDVHERSGTGVDPGVDTLAALAEAEAAEASQRTLARQRVKILEDLVQHRRSDWNYLKTMHEGSNFWLNVALLREQQVMNHVGEKQSVRRGAQFFYLGYGLGTLVGGLTRPERLAMDCCQLLEEVEFHFASSTVQGLKMMVATSSTLYEPLDTENGLEYSSSEPFRPTVYKWNQRPVYRRLLTPPIPFPLDYREVLLSLCDILALIYSKLVEDVSASEDVNLFQFIIRFDDRIKKIFIEPVKREFSAVASQVMAEEMSFVRSNYASGAQGGERALATSTSTTVVDSNIAAAVSLPPGDRSSSGTD